MATARKPFDFAEEDKKYDDPKSRGSRGAGSWLRTLRSLRRRRIFFGLLALWLLYLFIRNIPTDVVPVSQRYDRYGAQRLRNPNIPPVAGEAARRPPKGLSEGSSPDYDGPIKFYKLAHTLRAYESYYRTNNNVLFAFSNIKSASQVVSAACFMAYQNRTRVHVAMMGRQEVDAKDLLVLNGIPDNECPITWHNALPDYPAESTDERMKASVEAAIGHIHKTLSIQAMLFDDSNQEDDHFRSAVRTRTRYLWIPATNVPERDAWILAIDAQSLRQWTAATVDIIVRAPAESSGSVIRLLKSIQKADYGGLSRPKLTIELPAVTDQALLDYIAGFQWPPHASPSERLLTVRRRADLTVMKPGMAALSTLESFYPATLHSHVLVLSPDVELSSNYYQLLMYLLLEYKYGGHSSNVADKLFGITLETQPSKLSETDSSVSLAQAISGDAVLYFGDRWNDLHSFVSLRVQADPEWRQAVGTASEASETTPAWLEAASELMQAQGYFLLQPSLGTGASPLVTVHQELHHDLEEVVDATADQGLFPGGDDLELDEQNGVLSAGKRKKPANVEKPMLSSSSVMSHLQKPGDTALVLESIPFYDVTGKKVTWDGVLEQAKSYSSRFAIDVGGCSSKDQRAAESSGIEHLFCI